MSGAHPAPSTPDVQLADDARRPIRRALLSVYDKTGLAELATALHGAGVELVSTGSTAARIADAGVPVTRVEELTGFPECLEGRVKTLHPRVHAGILADTRKQDHLDQLRDLEIEPFDLVVVNLYPFADTVASGAAPDAVVEQIDIGGPSMVRAAAKNHPSVAVVVDPARYDDVTAAARAGGFTFAERKRLAAAAFAHTATYDVAVSAWFAGAYAPDEAATTSGMPDVVGATYERSDVLRYGENPHQGAALYTRTDGATGLAQATQLHGKAMSYNNYVDADAAWRAAHDHADPAVAIIKHANPCGIAVGADVAQAHARAHATDPVSAFGGVIAANRTVTKAAAEQIAPVFTEVVVAPGFEPEALEVLQAKKNIRLLVVEGAPEAPAETRPISGGLLVQAVDRFQAAGDDPASWTLASGEPADEATLADLAFAWRAVRAAKSNAILLAADGAAVGIGMGQVNRVDSCRLSVERANSLAEGAERARGAVAASDAFFPFADGLQVLLDAGVRAVVQPGGSIRDEEVVEAAKAAGVTMYLTGTRHFAH
ncbi:MULTISPECIES: bifunctional phosphoribosylaminoimidazolecarboxamide formyltransferase/IMP cyclohydrolase [unclassified Isoptericola]|uniref:bifunctional phosphoribosylaminoimidazolecarboxamide formyltransferase/IMP cyclohydrolase n=1 Tax=unclassified Isoptericola TaxID=2623355 RepID=UPI0027135C33|nr:MULTISPECIES: bifunctional phosphoribosylaminoimidazolecarboxamide formyltransferase/IMP cyclohydrolase [unclassified Isoptericola]MDO8143080.1 bifunctional phosphoribosylaminoimidazolecarboxamide formyltransferase/IMP cyclohydrolase [Isoptericola sp. 178]MDO8146941.1 bifunctional phosphoribosylaminoimidazolecarboxamide formyltransferase/IMP cyclohydrolase [Isoptericola sp. b515]MDO8150744.1 bifunctional phosphoribosylaminoimidazolecarboxamide formyltransferase/IMP cyclohydrolase [Isoptericol